jgi:hypothetical protein
MVRDFAARMVVDSELSWSLIGGSSRPFELGPLLCPLAPMVVWSAPDRLGPGVRGLAAAHEAWLLGDIAQVLPVAIASRRGNREDTLVDAFGLITSSPGSLRLVPRRHLCGPSTLTRRNVVYNGR